MATAVLTATAGGFAQSYAGLYHWALEHGLHGWKAESFPCWSTCSSSSASSGCSCSP
ncbi:hypothetical protein ACFQHO_50820 [Actinomadura yumaensis]|uniref:hypothetical protein n=1 Tax=Actinomadura yumaensis TaxID=111807 RepID=UPI00360CC477